MKNSVSKFVLLSGLVCTGLSSIAAADELQQREQAARQATGQFIKQLGGALKKEMANGGPGAAIGVCRDLGPQVAGEISRASGWRVTRVSRKVRNPMLGMPDSWEIKVLQAFEARAGKGEKYADMVFSEVVEEGGTRYFRFMKPIGTKPMCLTCHGDSEQIPQSVQARLDSIYPLDKAVGFRAGDLRGAVSIKQPMDIPLRNTVSK